MFRADEKRWFTRMHGTDIKLPSIKRAWAFPGGRFFTEREQARAAQVLVLGRWLPTSCSARAPTRSASTSRSGTSRSRSSAW